MKRVLIAALCIIVTGAFFVFPEDPEEIIVTLEKGDTLYAISREYDVPVEVILRVNHIEEDDVTKLRPGLKIKISAFHIVIKGDTLYGIAKKYEINLVELQEYNKFADEDTLLIGQKIYLPYEVPVGIDEGMLWPHSGKIESLQGKLTGVMIHGDEGDRVISVSSGRVKWKGMYASFGRVVMIESEDDYIYTYGGNEEIMVNVGDTVTVGMEIGRLAAGTLQNRATAIFFVHRDLQPVDPYHAPRK